MRMETRWTYIIAITLFTGVSPAARTTVQNPSHWYAGPSSRESDTVAVDYVRTKTKVVHARLNPLPVAVADTYATM
jgi:hypothetical protein